MARGRYAGRPVGSVGKGAGVRARARELGVSLVGVTDPELAEVLVSEAESRLGEQGVGVGAGSSGGRLAGAEAVAGGSAGSAGERLWERVGVGDAGWHRAGVLPGMSAWWRGVMQDWLCSDRRFLCVRCGRRGGKSTTCCKWVVCNVVGGEHNVPRGDLGVHAIISVERKDAVERIRTCCSLLTGLGYRETRATGGVVKKRGEYTASLAPGRTEIFVMTEFGLRCIRVYTASVTAVIGGTCIGILADELAYWQNKDAEIMSVKQASEVLSALKPSMATQRNARMAMISSPFSTLDAHYEEFEKGTSDHQLTAEAPTWIANPTLADCPVCGVEFGRECLELNGDAHAERIVLSEAFTHTLAEDDDEWECHYAARPRPAHTVQFYDPVAVERSMVRWEAAQ